MSEDHLLLDIDHWDQQKFNTTLPDMSSGPDDFPYSVAQQKALISANLNSTMLFQFLFGIYTGVFPATIYIYIHKENRTRARDRIIIGSTTALYFVTTVTILLNWLYTNIFCVTRNGTRVEMFIESITNQRAALAEEIITDLTIWVVFLLADGLLVWRCFHSCGRSFRGSFLPIVLFTSETVLALAIKGYSCFLHAKPEFETDKTDEIANRLNAATYVAAATTSLVCTVIICRQIWRHTTPISRSRKHYRTIISALVESSATYTLFVILSAILTFTVTEKPNEVSFNVLLIDDFIYAATTIISGLAPTLMIARLVLSSNPEGDTDISSAQLPSELLSRASHATAIYITNVVDNPEVQLQQRGSVEQANEGIEVVMRAAEYQPQGQIEDRLAPLV